MNKKQRLSTFGLTARLVTDFAILAFTFWLLLADERHRDFSWIVFDGACLALFTWLTFTDIHNWKDRGPRFVPVRRPGP
jgi:hypothetical protein